MGAPFVACAVKRLPEAYRPLAAETAIGVNPNNGVATDRLHLLPEGMATPQHLALLTGKKWAAGTTITVGFLDSPPPEFRAKFLRYANLWRGDASRVGGNLLFVESSVDPMVRVDRVPGDGYWSYLGTDILHVPAGDRTLNLDSFTASTPDSEWNRVVPHECGHGRGYPHEHSLPEIIGLLDPEKVIAFYMEWQGWSRDDTIAQILSPPAPGTYRSGRVGVRGVMCYPFGADLTRNGVAIPGGEGLTDDDLAMDATFYPGLTPPAPIPAALPAG